MNSRFTQVTLATDDIPGSKFSEPFNKHTVVELCWWLLCCGIEAPTSWKKARLVAK